VLDQLDHPAFVLDVLDLLQLDQALLRHDLEHAENPGRVVVRQVNVGERTDPDRPDNFELAPVQAGERHDEPPLAFENFYSVKEI
jgi:hypothetical protein